MRHLLQAHREIVAVLALFLALGMYYSLTTPLFEAPDEQWHFAFVQHVATGRGLPVQSADKATHLARQEGSQPPLYYLLAAAATFWIDTSDYPGIIWENPHYGYNVPGIVNDNKNLFIHTSLENWPFHGATLAIHIARALAVAMGALAVLFTYLLTLEIFPDRKFLAASAGAAVGFIPQFLFVSGAVSNDSTIVAMSALALWMTVRLFLVEPRLQDAIALGAATGLASLSKVSGAGLVLLGALVLAYVLRRDLKRLALALSAMGAIVMLVAGWWYLRNLILYGELTGTAMMIRIFGSRDNPLTAAQLLTQLDEVWQTFWVGFGWGNIRANPAVYLLLAILQLLSGVGLGLAFVRRRERIHPTLVKALPFFVLALWILVAFAELLHWMEITQAPHGRLFFPVLPALAPLAVFGITQWVPRRIEPAAARILPAALFVLSLAAPTAVLKPAYAYPPQLAEVPNGVRRVDLNYDNRIKLLGYTISPGHALPGQALDLTLYWESLSVMDEDYSIGIHLLDANQRVIGSRDSYPGHGLLPTRLWRPGQIVQDTYWLPVAPDAPATGIAQIHISVYTREDKRDLPAFDPNGREVTSIVGQVKIGGNGNAASRPENETTFSFGNQITLAGYTWDNRNLMLFWKKSAPVAEDFTVFVHVLDSSDNIVKQWDLQPGNGNAPTSLWEDGETVTDVYAVEVSAHGTYRVELGLYRPATMERLPVTDGNGAALGDHVTLGPFEVRP